MISSKERNFLRKKAHNLETVIRIGKEGLTDGILDSILKYIDKNEMVKIKLLQNSLEDVNNKLIHEIEEYSKSIFVASVGKTMIFFKEKNEKNKLGVLTREFYDFKKGRKI